MWLKYTAHIYCTFSFYKQCAQQRSICGHGNVSSHHVSPSSNRAVYSVSSPSMSQESSFETSASVQYKPKQAIPSATSPRTFDKDKRSKSASSRSYVSPSCSSVRSRKRSTERLCRRFTSPVTGGPRSIESIKREGFLSYKSRQGPGSSRSSSTSKYSGWSQAVSSLGKYTDSMWDSSYLQRAYPHDISCKGDRKYQKTSPPVAGEYSFTPIDTEECLNLINSNYLGAKRSKSLDERTYVAYQRSKGQRYNPKPISKFCRPRSTVSDPPKYSRHAQRKPLVGSQTVQVGL